jgi:hypothetical protein
MIRCDDERRRRAAYIQDEVIGHEVHVTDQEGQPTGDAPVLAGDFYPTAVELSIGPEAERTESGAVLCWCTPSIPVHPVYPHELCGGCPGAHRGGLHPDSQAGASSTAEAARGVAPRARCRHRDI